MSKICINVDFLAGTDIKDCIKEAKQKAYILNVAYITFKANGHSFSISKNADIEECMEQYHAGCAMVIS